MSPPADAVTNMAVDEALLHTAGETGDTWVRLYSWAQPSVSFGRNQRCDGVYCAAACDARGIPAVRRLTGGRALLHARELTYAVAAPTTAAPTLRGGYEAINRVLLDGLRALGMPVASAAPAGRTPVPGLAPCFESPSAGELVVGAAKLVGSAQHRDANAFLQHGSILLDDDQALLHEIALTPLPPVPPPATVRATLGDVSIPVVASAIAAAVARATTGQLRTASDRDVPPHHVAEALTRYRDARWTWRR